MNAIEDAVNGVEKAVNGVTALGTIIMHIVLCTHNYNFNDIICSGMYSFN